MKIFRARRNFKGSRGWVYEGTILMREYEHSLPTINDPECADNDWTYCWEEVDVREMLVKLKAPSDKDAANWIGRDNLTYPSLFTPDMKVERRKTIAGEAYEILSNALAKLKAGRKEE